MGELWRGRRRRKERIGAKAEEVEAGEAEFGSEKKLWNETKRLLERRWGGEGRVERGDEELLRTRGRLKRERVEARVVSATRPGSGRARRARVRLNFHSIVNRINSTMAIVNGHSHRL
jgi:hypothetical protein